MSLALAEGYVPQPPPTLTVTASALPSAPSGVEETEAPSPTSPIPSPTRNIHGNAHPAHQLSTTDRLAAGDHLSRRHARHTRDSLSHHSRGFDGGKLPRLAKPSARLWHLRAACADYYAHPMRRAVWLGAIHRSARRQSLSHQPTLSGSPFQNYSRRTASAIPPPYTPAKDFGCQTSPPARHQPRPSISNLIL